MKPTDFASPAEWQNIQSLFAAVTGLTSVTFDVEGNPVSPPDFQNEFCRAFKGTANGAMMCKESHQKIAEEALQKRAPVVGLCKAGLIKVVVPIFYKDEIIGFTGGCGVYHRDHGLDVAKLIEAGSFAGIDADKVKELAETIKSIDNKTIEEEINVLESKIKALMLKHEL